MGYLHHLQALQHLGCQDESRSDDIAFPVSFQFPYFTPYRDQVRADRTPPRAEYTLLASSRRPVHAVRLALSTSGRGRWVAWSRPEPIGPDWRWAPRCRRFPESIRGDGERSGRLLPLGVPCR